jgi:hypothetical protein
MERMAYDAQEKDLTVHIPGITDVLGSVWAKLLTILGVISLLIGIVLEVQALIGGYYGMRKSYYDMRKASADMCDAKTRAIMSSIYGVTQIPGLAKIEGWTTGPRGKTGEELFDGISDECSKLLAE